jgi:hypothetical protein
MWTQYQGVVSPWEISFRLARRQIERMMTIEKESEKEMVFYLNVCALLPVKVS